MATDERDAFLPNRVPTKTVTVLCAHVATCFAFLRTLRQKVTPTDDHPLYSFLCARTETCRTFSLVPATKRSRLRMIEFFRCDDPLRSGSMSREKFGRSLNSTGFRISPVELEVSIKWVLSLALTFSSPPFQSIHAHRYFSCVIFTQKKRSNCRAFARIGVYIFNHDIKAGAVRMVPCLIWPPRVIRLGFEGKARV